MATLNCRNGDDHPRAMDHRLIFLISQPRAGSTLLQRILGGHPEIHTASEPWVMLHPIFALRREGVAAPYEAVTANDALSGFLQTVQGGEDAYYEALRFFGSHLYRQALAGTGCRYFLDKTPRYYLVIRELAQIFPRAKFVILLRNPLAVLASIVRTWHPKHMSRYKADLLSAPTLLVDGIRHLGNRCSVVHYEAIVKDPENELRKLLDRLELDDAPNLADYGANRSTRWPFGDQGTVYERSQPVASGADRWLDDVAESQLWRMASDYLDSLGPGLLKRMGYDHETLSESLAERRPGFMSLTRTKTLVSLLGGQLAQRHAKRYGVTVDAA